MTGVSRRWPEPLRPGDLVAAVAPSGPARVERIGGGIALAESWGLRVRVAPRAAGRHRRLGYLAATDAERAADLQQAWCDPDVRAVWAVRGGYGAQRMVDRLDLDALRAAGRKHLIGFSDVTALHTRLGRELGLVTVHAPGLSSVEQLADPVTRAALRAALLDRPSPEQVLGQGRSLLVGSARGALVGGNLTLLAADVGIEPAPAEATVLLLEEVNEPPYRIDRLLTQLLRAGWFAAVTGVVCGDLGLGDDEVLLDRLAPLGIPVLTGLGVGHGSGNLALPLGADVRLEATGDRAVLRLDAIARRSAEGLA
jgi:muramoyltetrapeptide carboxypeptidase